MTKVIVDGKEIDVPPESTLMQACEEAGIEVPRFCFHERLSIAGNCRICLVEVSGSPKPVASCAMAVRDLRPNQDGSPPQILTTTPTVRKAREGVMEFLLMNHPLDCPVCDQGGECDLQDQAMAYGVDGTRFAENKRAVPNLEIGPLVKTEMTRCIHCTRCVRFLSEVAGVPELGALGRGMDMTIAPYLEQSLTSELQGNLIDLCPVGALTAKPHALTARPWELKKTETIDVMDALGSAIRVDTRGSQTIRILPRINEDINEEWISDKTRFVVDGLNVQRLDIPYVRKNGQLQPVSWEEALTCAAERLRTAHPNRIGAIIGDLAGVEESYILKRLMDYLDTPHVDCRQDGTALDPHYGRMSYIFNATLAGIEDADVILLIGANPRSEAAVLNARLRKCWFSGSASIALIGPHVDLTFPYTYLGDGPKALNDLVTGRSTFSAVLASAKRPLVIVGQGALTRDDGHAVFAQIARLALTAGLLTPTWTGLNILHTAAARVGCLDLGLVPKKAGFSAARMAKSHALDVLFLLGADELEIEPGPFVIYQGSHGDRGAHRADIIFPSAAYTEKSVTYVNTEGRVQRTFPVSFPPGLAQEDWLILVNLAHYLGLSLPFDTLHGLRESLYADYPHFEHIDHIHRDPFSASLPAFKILAVSSDTCKDTPFQSPIEDFYMTNPIARASRIMARCSALRSSTRET
jgi:NADH-quinone oxidoreductase subunit G